MEYTQNYQLPLWDKEDAVKREDFNDSNQKMETALVALQSVIDVERIVTGSYTGDGTMNRTIALGFTPKCVIQMGRVNTSTGAVSITTGTACWCIAGDCGSSNNTIIVENGFQTACFSTTWHNAAGKSEHYIAFH